MTSPLTIGASMLPRIGPVSMTTTSNRSRACEMILFTNSGDSRAISWESLLPTGTSDSRLNDVGLMWPLSSP